VEERRRVAVAAAMAVLKAVQEGKFSLDESRIP
jgi:hypothetical protein